MTEFNRESVKKFVEDPKNLKMVADYVELQEVAARLRVEMDALYDPIFAKYEFINYHTGERIADKKDLYMSKQEDLVTQYFNETEEARRNAGYELPPDHCPALVAAYNVVEHEWKMLEAMGELLGVDGLKVYGEKRQKMLDLFVQIAFLKD